MLSVTLLALPLAMSLVSSHFVVLRWLAECFNAEACSPREPDVEYKPSYLKQCSVRMMDLVGRSQGYDPVFPVTWINVVVVYLKVEGKLQAQQCMPLLQPTPQIHVHEL